MRGDPKIRMLDQSQIGAILTGNDDALKRGPAGHRAFRPNDLPFASPPIRKQSSAALPATIYSCACTSSS